MNKESLILVGAVTVALGALIAVAIARKPHRSGLSTGATKQTVLKLTPLAAPKGTSQKAVLSLGHALWSKAPQIPLRLSRTPPLYAGGHNRDDGHRPSATVRLVKLTGGEVMVRLSWTDPTEDTSKRTKRIADVGSPKIYSRHPRSVSGFADAVAVMLPRKRGPHDSYPSLMMGHKGAPVDLYFWRAGLGFQKLSAAGRGTTTLRRREKLGGVARRTSQGWVVVLPVGKVPARTPVSFAIWDGKRRHRDGLKYFTVWYEIW